MNHPIVHNAANVLRQATVLILGGGGLVGTAIAKHLGRLPATARPSRVVVAALTEDAAHRAVQELEDSRPKGARTKYIPAWGDVFVRQSLANVPSQIRKNDPAMRDMMLHDTFGDFRAAFEKNHLVSLVREHKPSVVVDCINTATVFSYQDMFTASTRLRQTIGACDTDAPPEEAAESILPTQAENVLLSLATPPLIRHVKCLQQVSREQQVQGFLKIGTTGTGGMGLNIPYTHSEDRPSQMLLAKAAAGFGHSGLLLLWSMTPGAPFVKELKPAAAIGYKSMEIREVADTHGNTSLYGGRIMSLRPSDDSPRVGHSPQVLSLREDPSRYRKLGSLRMAVVDLGENGMFTKEEFITITSPDQMELVSPEEISELAIEELLSISTGHNVLAALRGSLLGPGYRAGINRAMACEQLEQLCDGPLEEQATAASVALGKLGPPSISKLLFEARILTNQFQTWEELRDCDPKALSETLATIVSKATESPKSPPVGSTDNLLSTAISVGVPVIFSDDQLLRGPNISIPEAKMSTDIPLPSSLLELNEIADKGWIDLRAPNLERWQARAGRIVDQLKAGSGGRSSGHYLPGDWRLYKSTKGSTIDPPAAVAWILAVELGGHRDIV